MCPHLPLGQWIFLEGMASTSGEPDLYRLASIGHGYVETVSSCDDSNVTGHLCLTRRRQLDVFGLHQYPTQTHPGPRRYKSAGTSTPLFSSSRGHQLICKFHSAVISFFLMVDLMRALYTGSAATVASSFKDVPLASRDISIAYIRTKLITQLQPMPPTPSSDENLLILLVILNEIIVYASLCPQKHIRIRAHNADESMSSRSGSSDDSFTPLSHGNEILRARKCLIRVLDAWITAYQMSNGPERLALYNYCKLYVTFPEVHLLPIAAGFGKDGVRKTNPEGNTFHFYDMDDQLVAETSHYAWLILENITASQGFLPVWCPVVTFSAALVIWMCTQVQGKFEKARGSLMVMRLFKSELERMPWLCAADMAEFLEQLAA